MNGDSAAAVERLEALFRGARLEDLKKPREHFILETKVDTRTCGLHGRHSLQHNGIDNRRGSLGNILHQQQQRRRDGVGPRRESMPALHVASRRRDSLALPPPRRPDVLTHPSAFPSTLRRDSTGTSMGSLKKGSLSKSTTHLRRDSTPGLLEREFHTASHASLRRESVSSIPFSRKSSQISLGSSRKDSLNSLIGAGPRDAWRRVSTDSLDSARRNSLDVGRRDSAGWKDPIWEEIIKKMGKDNYNQHTHGIAGLFAYDNYNQHTHGIAGLFAWSNDSNKKPTYGRFRVAKSSAQAELEVPTMSDRHFDRAIKMLETLLTVLCIWNCGDKQHTVHTDGSSARTTTPHDWLTLTQLSVSSHLWRRVLFLETGEVTLECGHYPFSRPSSSPLTHMYSFTRTVLYSVGQDRTSRTATCAVLSDLVVVSEVVVEKRTNNTPIVEVCEFSVKVRWNLISELLRVGGGLPSLNILLNKTRN
uniref:Uncharacterized protein n=1 Tax=Timema cristinae TaxID=61476 RepID=A0A7R9C9L1_TIMCR|nr:unnamed protein product [Timema cristinae]